MTENLCAHELTSTYVHLGEGGTSTALEVTASFWPDLMASKLAHLGPGRLVIQACFADDWSNWEMHPNGDEVVLLLAGEVDLVLEQKGGHRTVELRSLGSFALIPRGIWHTANTDRASSMLFITAGEGTEHRPRR